jgi:diaminopimelate epimerase
MCGNAIRCVACYIFERDLWPLADDVCESFDPSIATTAEKEAAYGQLRVETLAGVKSIDVVLCDVGRAIEEDPSTLEEEEFVLEEAGIFLAARVDMGIAEVDTDVEIAGRSYSRVSMGNPHAVTFVDKLPREFGTAPITTEGPVVELDPIFPNKTNVEFAEVEDPQMIHMRAWERGVGETYACGTGACATVVVAKKKGLVSEDKDIVVELVGGTLVVEVKDDMRVFMTGAAMEVYTGSIDIDC